MLTARLYPTPSPTPLQNDPVATTGEKMTESVCRRRSRNALGATSLTMESPALSASAKFDHGESDCEHSWMDGRRPAAPNLRLCASTRPGLLEQMRPTEQALERLVGATPTDVVSWETAQGQVAAASADTAESWPRRRLPGRQVR